MQFMGLPSGTVVAAIIATTTTAATTISNAKNPIQYYSIIYFQLYLHYSDLHSVLSAMD